MNDNPMQPNQQPTPAPMPNQPTPPQPNFPPAPQGNPEPFPLAPNNFQPNQPVEPNRPTQMGQPMPSQPAPQAPKKKNNTLMYVLIGIIALILIAGVILAVVLLNNNGNGNGGGSGNVNDYESPSEVVGGDDKEEEEESDTVTLGAFTFTKDSYYDYSLSGDTLQITDGEFATAVTLMPYSFDQVLAEKESIASNFEDEGVEVKKTSTGTYSGLDALVFLVKQEGIEAYYYIFDAGHDYCFSGATANDSGIASTSDLTTSAELLAGAKYNSSYKAEATDRLPSSVTIFNLEF